MQRKQLCSFVRSLKFAENFTRICGDGSCAMREISCKFFEHAIDLEIASQRERGMTDAQTPNHSSTASLEPQAQDGREHARRSVLWPARLMIAGKRDVRCFVIDLANGGAKLRTEQPVALGTMVKLRSP